MRVSPTPPLPTLSWENNCNKRFKAWFGNDPDFSKLGIKKMALTYTITNPNGVFTKELTSSQWLSIRRLVGDVTGGTVYWYVESWGGANRHSQTGVMNFTLTD